MNYRIFFFFLKIHQMKTCTLRTQNMVKMDISTNYNEHVTVQIWRETMEQTRHLCKLKQYNQ